MKGNASDLKTAQAFSSSWLNLPTGSVYTFDQFEDWMSPLTRADFEGKAVLEMGCGNGSQMMHAATWRPQMLVGIDLGDSVHAATENLRTTDFTRWHVEQADLMTYSSSSRFDLVYCIGVLHHLSSPQGGFNSVLHNVRPGGSFHCWVYAREGNLPVRLIVEPLRRVFSRLPWWITKYLAAPPLAVLVFAYAKLIIRAKSFLPSITRLPLSSYCLWIGQREFSFFRHVVFDQLVTPTTHYIPRNEIESWLADAERIDPGSVYIIMRNGNSWKFGGRRRAAADPALR